jgi:hypothetical protein
MEYSRPVIAEITQFYRNFAAMLGPLHGGPRKALEWGDAGY